MKKNHPKRVKTIIKRPVLLLFLYSITHADPIINIWYIGIRENPVYNHYIEIYNPTEEIIDLSEYAFLKGHGQSNAIGYGWGNELSNSGVSFYRLSGSLFPGSSMGFARDVSHESLQNMADVVFEGECVLAVSGDDAVGLFKGPGDTAEEVLSACDSIPIDAVGSPYEDPGQSWQVSGEAGPPNSTNTGFYGVTRFAILMRKPVVGMGNAGDWDSSRGCVADSCTNDTITTSYEESEWNIIPCYFYEGCDPTNTIITNGAGAEPDCPDASLDIDSMATYYYEPGTAVFDSTIVLNEFLANSETCCGEGLFGGGEDFIELYNIGTDAVNISGWGFGDTESEAMTMAPDTSIAAGAYVVLWYTGEPNGFPEVNAELSEDGEAVYVEDAVGNVIINYAYDEQMEDVSYGRIPDGSETWQHMNPTPNETNTDQLFIVGQNKIIPDNINIVGNYPNPFNPITTIVFQLPALSSVRVNIYNISGKRQRTINLGLLESGTNTVYWDGLTEKGARTGSGIYLYQIKAGSQVATGKMALIK